MTATAVVIGALVLCAAVGLAAVPAASRSGRLSAWAVALLFAAVALDPTVVGFAEVAPRHAVAAVAGEPPAVATAALQAAVAAGPRAVDLTLVWHGSLAAGGPTGPLGALAEVAAEPLPFAPERLQVEALGRAAVGRPVPLRITAPGADGPLRGELRVRAPGGAIWREAIALVGAQPLEVAFVPSVVGDHEVELALAVGGVTVRASGVLAVAGAPPVLVLEPSGAIAAALRAQGVAVQAIAALPADLRSGGVLVLGEPLDVAQQTAVTAALADGLGAFVLAPAFGAVGEPLRAQLPVRPLPPPEGGAGDLAGNGEPTAQPSPEPPPADPKPPEPTPPPQQRDPEAPVAGDPIEVDKRSIAMVLLVDRSGSMGTVLPNGQTRMSYAKTSALRTALALGEGDQVGLVTFGNKGQGRVELPLCPATDLDAVRAGMQRLAHAAELTFLLDGLEKAQDLLRGSGAAVKHVVVISDGEFDLSEQLALRARAYAMRSEDHVTLSVITIDDGSSDPGFRALAEMMTRDGGGQFVPIADPASVPVLVSAEVTRALERVGRSPNGKPRPDARPSPEAPPTATAEPPPSPREPRPAPPKQDAPPAARLAVHAVAEVAMLRPLPRDEWPTLAAALPTVAPLDAQVLLVAGDAGWPLLAFANRGLGRIGAFAADLAGPAGQEFRRDPAFAARLAQWVQNVLPGEARRAPVALVARVVTEPVVPTPRDLDQLAALGGAPVQRAADAGAIGGIGVPDLARTAASRVPQWSLWLVLALVGLAAVERLSGPWSARRSAAG